MELLLILIAVGVFSVLLNKSLNNALVTIIGVVAISSLVLYLITILFLYYTTKAEIKEFQNFESEVEDAKRKGSMKDNIVIQFKINESNEWLDNAQDWNNSIFELCIPDEINNLQPIK